MYFPGFHIDNLYEGLAIWMLINTVYFFHCFAFLLEQSTEFKLYQNIP